VADGWGVRRGSLARGMVADGYRAGRFDVTGALICLAGVAFIMSATRRVLARQPAGTLPGPGDLGLLCGVLALLLVAFSLGLSNFAAAIGIGVAGTGARTRLRVGILFGLFEAGMPILGLVLGRGLASTLGSAGGPLDRRGPAHRHRRVCADTGLAGIR